MKNDAPRRARGRPAAGYARGFVQGTVAALIVVIVSRTWILEGYLVASGSMADALLGAHRYVECDECGIPLRCGTDLTPPAKTAWCHNCGYAGTELANRPVTDGDRLLVGRSAFAFRGPSRWEIVAFRSPDEPRTIYVKRVVGLPREVIQLRDGDVYADGRIARKTLAQQRSLAILVHDALYAASPAAQMPQRWRGLDDDSRWQRTPRGFHYPAPDDARGGADAAAPVDWLTYHHWQRLRGTPARAQSSPILDHHHYNQPQPRLPEEAQIVHDLLLTCRLRASGAGRLTLQADDGRDRLEVTIDPSAERAELRHNERLVATATGGGQLAAADVLVEMSTIDHQFVLALDGVLLFEPYGYPPGDGPWQPTSRPLAVGSQALELELADVKVFRDVYYTDPRAGDRTPRARGPYRLGADEYFMLGDNSPISRDSRVWRAGPGVPERLLVGKPLCVHWPSRRIELGPFNIQVPDLARIRYIR